MIDIYFWTDSFSFTRLSDYTSLVISCIGLLVNVMAILIVVLFYYKERHDKREDYKKTFGELLRLGIKDIKKQVKEIEDYYEKLERDNLDRESQPHRYMMNNLESISRLDLTILHTVFRKNPRTSLIDCNEVLVKTTYFKNVFDSFFNEHFRKREEVNRIQKDYQEIFFRNLMELYDHIIWIMSGGHKIEFSREFYDLNRDFYSMISEFNKKIKVKKFQNIRTLNNDLLIPLRERINEPSNEIQEIPNKNHLMKLNLFLLNMEKVVSEIEILVKLELNEIDSMKGKWENYVLTLNIILQKF